jgi:DJ-1/PfpI family
VESGIFARKTGDTVNLVIVIEVMSSRFKSYLSIDYDDKVACFVEMLQLHLAAIFGLLMIAYACALGRFNFHTVLRKGTSSGRIALRMASSDSNLSRNVLVAIADGSEEIEAVTIVDTLVRAGATVTVASVSSSLQVTCSRGVKLVADRLITDCTSSDWDLM